MRRWQLVAASAALLLAAASCRTMRPGAPVEGVVAGSAAAEFEQLLAKRGVSLQAIGKMRIAGRSFNAAVASDGETLRIEAFTPVGTTVFVLYGRGDDVTVASASEAWYWRGSMAELAGSFDLPTLPLRDLGRLLFGVPPETGSPSASGREVGVRADASTFDSPRFRYSVSPSGLARVTIRRSDGGSAGEVTYDPPQFPPRRISIVEGERTIDVTYSAVETFAGGIDAPRIDPSWRRLAQLPRP